LTFDYRQRVTSVNGPACEVLSVKRPEQDADWRELLSQWPELGKVLEGWFTITDLEKQLPNRRYVTLERGGRSLTYRMAIFPLSFRQQAGWLLTIEDLTERVSMRQQMARMDRLASLGRMSAGIAHEVRNPLTGVSLLLDELHDRLLGKEEDQKLIRRALGEIERLEMLVNEMLRFSSMPAPQLSHGRIESVLQESLYLIRKQCQRQKVQLVERLAAELPEVRIDSDRLKQVLLNLYNNALDAMPKGGTLTVSAELQDDAVVVPVADTGAGIPAEQVPLVFEPFYTSKGQGTGLGLSISYNIISDHGGELTVASRPGEETVFRFSLPLS
jgi:signal transduction histidine kinase